MKILLMSEIKFLISNPTVPYMPPYGCFSLPLHYVPGGVSCFAVSSLQIILLQCPITPNFSDSSKLIIY